MRLMKLLGYVLGAVVALALVAIVAIYVMSERRVHRRYEVVAEEIVVSADADAVERGAHVAVLRGCPSCHGGDLSGTHFVDDPMLGDIYSANLTPGGVGGTLTPAQWEHALRHGVAHDGRSLIIMPALELHDLGNEDLADLIAYLHSLPAVTSERPAPRLGPVGRALLVFNVADVVPAEHIDHAARHRPAPPVAVTPEYGAYLASSCTGCHKSDFAGGPIPGEKGVIAANLTMDAATGLGRWSEADFVKTVRTGTRPDGSVLSPVMPWPITAQMTDTEISAIWSFLKTLPVRPARTK